MDLTRHYESITGLLRFFPRIGRNGFLVCSLVLAGASAAQTQSGQVVDLPFIDGSIQFNGGAALNGSLATATAFTSIFGPGGTGTLPVVLGGPTTTGDYFGVPDGTPVSFQIFTFPSSNLFASLWSFSIGSTAYSFDATSITVDHQSANFLDIEGMGTAHITGYSDTPAIWSVTDTIVNGAPVPTFGAYTAEAPEPSPCLLLLAFLPAVLLSLGTRAKSERLKAELNSK